MSVSTCPAILIAAPASGQGKTTVACALARLHTRQGRRVRVFKCGPDFLDPHWLTLASSNPVHQLDLWMTGEAVIADGLEIVRRDPDIIFGSWCGKKFRPELVAARPGWENVAAIKNHQLFEIKASEILQPGPTAWKSCIASSWTGVPGMDKWLEVASPERPAMKRLLMTVLLCLVALSNHAQALQLTDDRGIRVTFAQSPQRIVSLLPSLTESVCAMEQCQRLVGVDRYSNYPASVRRLPVLGDGLDPNIEGVVALKPDVVLLATSSRASQRLESLGIKVVALEPRSHADVRRVLKKIGQLLEIPDEQGADRLWRIIDTSVSAAAQSLPAKVRDVRVYFEVNRGPYAAGELSFIGETLTRLGVKNIVPAALGPFPRLNPEFVVRANPDVIMVGSGSMQAIAAYPGWGSIKAVREQRICVFSSEESDVVVRPGPRMAEAARIMAKCLEDKAP